MSARDLRTFSTEGYLKGRSVPVQALWFVVQNVVFMQWWCPSALRVRILRWFGGSVGEGVRIRHRVRVHWPWKITLGDYCWIGEGAWLLNLEPIVIEPHACISQEAFLCTGGHDHQASDFRFRNGPIRVGAGAWVGARAIVLPGVRIDAEAVVGAGAVAARDVAPGEVLTTVVRRPTVDRGSTS
jgi:putative colanic acid biosynthesis acetyltransferase WcaF